MKKLLALLAILALTLACCPALADSVTLSGTVVSTQSTVVPAPIGGTVDSLNVAVGDHVASGKTIATLRTVTVYAQEAGIVRLFGKAGDPVEAVTERYGAVAYVEPTAAYTITASTKQAYDAEANRVIHPGEKVYLRSYSDAKVKGRGTVTQVSGTSFTVEVTSGSFSTGESVFIFRLSSYAADSRIGRGSVAHVDPKAYTGEGSIVRFLVKSGDEVARGTALFETLPGQFDALKMTGAKITSSADGTVASLSVTPGTAVEKGAAAAEIYLDSGMRVQLSASEAELRSLAVGTAVTVEFPYLQDNLVTVNGKVERISSLADGTNPDQSEEAASDEAFYLVYISFDAVKNLRYGMSAVVSTQEAAPAAK